jgi:hypothetical protein
VTGARARPVARRRVVPVYAAGFVTAFGAHAMAANKLQVVLAHQAEQVQAEAAQATRRPRVFRPGEPRWRL